MLLFLHGTGATGSLWIEQIRSLLSLDTSYSDKFILDLFTLSLPGHPNFDRNFTLSETEKLVQDFVLIKKDRQQQLAKELILSKNKEIIEAVKSEKLILFGHSVGGVIALNYALRNSHLVNKIILISCGFSFNKLALNFLEQYYKRLLFKENSTKLQKRITQIRNKRWKIALNIFLENYQRKGFLSAVQIAKSYNFKDLYKRHSLDEHLRFSQIPILLINGRFDLLNLSSSSLELKKFLYKQIPTLQSINKTYLATKNSFENIKVKLYPWSGHNPVDMVKEFIQDVQAFIKE